jgi:DNA-binding transcriptional MocR family regulator
MWVRLPGVSVDDLAVAGAEHGVAFVKGADFLLEGGADSVRLAYSGLSVEQIEEGVTRLAAAVRSLQK